MARISKGILGDVSGTVGSIVGSSWRGIGYIRSKSTRRKNSSTPKQLNQRAKFKLAGQFLSTLTGLLEISFRGYANGMTGRNTALSYTLENSITGQYPDFSLDFSKILVARGNKLPNASGPATASTSAGNIGFTWVDNAGAGQAAETDVAIMVAHCPELNQTVFTTAGPARSAGAGSLSEPAFSGKQVHTWLSFLAENGKDVATSVYTGMVSVQ